MDQVLAFRVDHHPLLGHMMQQMALSETINATLGEETGDMLVDTGTVVSAMIHNLLGDGALRLYKVQDFFADKALPLLFTWSPQLDLAQLNDDRVGRALDSIWAAGPQKVFSALGRVVIERYALDLKAVHNDTTSRSFYGAYAEQEPAAPQVTYGYSKDHRPDLKQILFGVGTSRDGVPVLAEACSGNQSDMTWNGRWIVRVREQLGLLEDKALVYAADSALVTTDNLEALAKARLDFISRLPERFGLAEELMREALKERPSWEDIGALVEGAKAARYHLWEVERELEGRHYRFTVVYSSSLDERRLRTLDKGVAKEAKELGEALAALAKQRFVCAPDAERAWERFRAEQSSAWHRLVGQVSGEEQRIKRAKRGRPRTDEEVVRETMYRIGAKLERDEERYEQAREKCGMFVLISNLRDKAEWSGQEILAEYKGQTGVERIFRFLKNPAWVGAFCLKNPARIAALGFVVLMAAMVYTLLERQVRQALAQPGQGPVEGLNRQLTKKPTSYAVQTAISGILVVGVRRKS